MIDSGAINNFVANREATCLQLALQKNSHTIKTANAVQQWVRCITMVTLKVGAWEG